MTTLPAPLFRSSHDRDPIGSEIHVIVLERPTSGYRRMRRDTVASPRPRRRRLRREVRASLGIALIVSITAISLVALAQQRSALDVRARAAWAAPVAQIEDSVTSLVEWPSLAFDPAEEAIVAPVPILAVPTGILLPDEGSEESAHAGAGS